MQYYSNYQVKNEILNSMSPEAFGRIMPDLERVDFPQATPVYSAYEPISHVYFPEGAMASIFATTSDGHSAEIGVVGREGAAGWPPCARSPWRRLGHPRARAARDHAISRAPGGRSGPRAPFAGADEVRRRARRTG